MIGKYLRKLKKLGPKLAFMKFIGYEAIFSCAFRISEDDGWVVLPHSENYWYADPLIWTRDGRQIVYMERVDRSTGIGSIVASDITDGVWADPVPVIEEPFHMSFPMCFDWNGELYMIPETEMDEALNLYRCTSFPYGWEHAGRFPVTGRIVDTVADHVSPDNVELIGSQYNADDDFYTRFVRFIMKRDDDGVLTVSEPKLTDPGYTLKSRMAGYPLDMQELHSGLPAGSGSFTDRDQPRRLYPVQRSTSGIYGYSVMFMADDPLEGKTVCEVIPSQLQDISRKLIGVHTYSRSDVREVIDIQYLARKVR